MARTPDHEAVSGLLAVYALDALDDAERREVEAHLASCDACRRRLAEHHEVLAALAGEGEAPPSGTWDRIVAEVRRNEHEDPLPSPVPSRVRRLPRPEVWLTGAAAVAVVAAVVVLLGDKEPVSVGQLLRRGYETALDDPGATVAQLRAAEGAVAVTAVVDEDGAGFLEASDLPAAGEGRAYQLWRVDGDTAVSVGVLGDAPGVVAFQAGTGVETLAVSLEVAGGATSPSQVVVAGEVAPA